MENGIKSQEDSGPQAVIMERICSVKMGDC